MRINNNLMAMNTHRQLGIVTDFGAKSTEKLSSGYRINRAGDDAAGLAISEKMRGQIRGLNMASKNAQDGISLIQTAEGALNETHAILQRMRELAVQSATDTNTEIDRSEIQKEIDQLAEEITRIADTTEFNTQNLLGGKFEGTFHIGANEEQNIVLAINDMSANALKVAGGVELLESGEATTEEIKAIEGFGEYSGEAVDVLKDGEGNIVAIKAGSGDASGYYALEDLKLNSDNDGFEILDGAKLLSVEDDGFALDGKLLVKAEETVLGKSGTDVLKDGDSAAAKTVAVKIGDTDGKWYALDNVKLGDGDALEAIDEDKVLDVKTGSYLVDKDGDPLGKTGGINVSTQTAADKAITVINDAIETVSAERSKLGAMQNRLEHTIKNLDTSAENLQASESRIRDVDMAKEMMEFTKQNILQQASTAMLAQANMAPQSVLQLLR